MRIKINEDIGSHHGIKNEFQGQRNEIELRFAIVGMSQLIKIINRVIFEEKIRFFSSRSTDILTRSNLSVVEVTSQTPNEGKCRDLNMCDT